MSVWFSAGFAIAGAATELTAGAASRASNVTTVLLWSAPSALATAVIAALLVPGPTTAESIWFGLFAGLVGGAALPLAFRALAIGPIGVVASLIACTSTIALGTVGIVTEGAPSAGVWVGMALCLVALVSLGRRRVEPKSLRTGAEGVAGSIRPAALLLAVGAGLGYAGFTLLMSLSQQGDPSGLALVAARFAVLVVACCLPLLTGMPRRPTIGIAALSVSAGVLDVAGNLFLLAALATTPLITVAIVGATTPGLAAVGAAILLKERLTAWQIGGIAMAGVGAILAATA